MNVDRLMTDDELRPLLEAKEVIRFDGLSGQYDFIYEQVSRLGFEDRYRVSRTKVRPGDYVLVVPLAERKVNRDFSKNIGESKLAKMKSKYQR